MQFTDVLNTAAQGMVRSIMPTFLQTAGFGDLANNANQGGGSYSQNNWNAWNEPTTHPLSMGGGMNMVDPFATMVWGRPNPLASSFGMRPGSSIMTSPLPDMRTAQPGPTPAVSGPTPVASPAATPAATPAPQPAPGPVVSQATSTPVPMKPSQNVLNFATQALGVQYVWGGESPNSGFDCSGLVQWAYSKLGVNLPRVAQDQYNATTRVDMANLQPGDLVFFHGTDPSDPAYISHVGIYAGNGQMINAPSEGQPVQYVSLTNPYWASHFAGGGRVGQ